MLEVIEPGLLTTVQDAGRYDALDLGVPVSGACDPWSLAMANVAVGNPAGSAALEMTLLGGVFRAIDSCTVATAGADMGGGAGTYPTNLRRGDVLRFGPAEPGTGIRTYLALAGGVDVPTVLGSRSTCLAGGFGGFDGRGLRTGDVIQSGRVVSTAGSLTKPNPPIAEGSVVRVIAGSDHEAIAQLVAQEWRVSARADRQGMRLEGLEVASSSAGSILSRPVGWGTIQLPPDGFPIVLLADAQTVGGYRVLGTVISADLHLIGQLGPADKLGFELVSIAQAQAALRDRQRVLDTLPYEW